MKIIIVLISSVIICLFSVISNQSSVFANQPTQCAKSVVSEYRYIDGVLYFIILDNDGKIIYSEAIFD